MAETIKACQCIGCGRLEAAAQCVGACQDQPVELVALADYEGAVAACPGTGGSGEADRAHLPEKGGSRADLAALQAQARQALARATGGQGAPGLAKVPAAGP